MTAMQLNAELYRTLGEIAEDENMLTKVLRYAQRLLKKQSDPTLMSREEFFHHVDEAEAQYARGEYTTQLEGESVTDMLKRCGYAL